MKTLNGFGQKKQYDSNNKLIYFETVNGLVNLQNVFSIIDSLLFCEKGYKI